MDADKATQEISGQVPQCLEGLDSPAPKKDVIGQAEKEQANSAVISALRTIPEGMYNSADEVAEHVSGKHE